MTSRHGLSRYLALAAGVVAVAVAGYLGYVLYPRFDLPAVAGPGLLALGLAAGVASFFSPCSFPLLVTILARETGAEPDRPRRLRRATAFAAAMSLGAVVFLAAAGGVIALGGAALAEGVTFTSVAGRVIRGVVGGLLILLGLVQLGALPAPFHVVARAGHPLSRGQARLRRERPLAGFLVFGFTYLLAGFG